MNMTVSTSMSNNSNNTNNQQIFIGQKRREKQKEIKERKQNEQEDSDNSIIRTVKNKKVVYCQTDFLQKQPSMVIANANNNHSVNIPKWGKKKENELDFNKMGVTNKNGGKGMRGSRFRGVSKNGNQWQVLIMINKKKRYIGNYKTEEEAASAYDYVAIQNHRKKAKTNFYYTKEEIKEIEKLKNIDKSLWGEFL